MPEFGTRAAMLAAWEKLWERWSHSNEALRTRSPQEEWWPAFMAEVRQQQRMGDTPSSD